MKLSMLFFLLALSALSWAEDKIVILNSLIVDGRDFKIESQKVDDEVVKANSLGFELKNIQVIINSITSRTVLMHFHKNNPHDTHMHP